MPSRRSRALFTAKGTLDLTVLEVTDASTRPITLSQGSPLIFRGHGRGEVKIAASEDGTLEVQAAEGAAVRLNDVQVRGTARARVGDLISLADRSLLVQRLTTAPQTAALPATHEVFEQRVLEEVARATATEDVVSLLIVRSRALVGGGLADFLAAPEFQELYKRERPILVGQAAPAALEFLCPGAAGSDADDVRAQLSEALGRLGRPVRWGWATLPTEARHPASLWGRALDRMFAERPEVADDLPRADPVMVRLWAFCDVWSGAPSGVLLCSELGSGRETLARAIHERRAAHAPFVAFRASSFDRALWRASLDRARGGSLYVRHMDALPALERVSFWEATSFRPMAAGHAATGKTGWLGVPPIVVSVPALRDRPLDVLPIAEYVLSRCTGPDSVRRPKLTASAKSLLSAGWIGSVRELKNSLQRASLLVDPSCEVLLEHIISGAVGRVANGARESDLRALLRSVERRSFLDALAGTNWNVTQAARALGLPRRTVIYKMSRLGLRRPATSR